MSLNHSILVGLVVVLGLAHTTLPARGEDANAPATATADIPGKNTPPLSPEAAAAELKASNIPFDQAIPLWPGMPPDAAPDASPATEVVWAGPRLGRISIPALIPYFPAHPNGTAMIYCPGGGYVHENMASADLFAKYFNEKDITVFALEYRLLGKASIQDVSVEDGLRAVQLVRSRAAEWHLNPQRIGLSGASAGANVALHVLSEFKPASGAATGMDQVSSRPDFVVLLSCWAYKDKVSPYPLRQDSPPVFLCHADDDKTAPTALSQNITQTLTGFGVPVYFLKVPAGGHGAFTLDQQALGRTWPETFLPWLQKQGMLDSAATGAP